MTEGQKIFWGAVGALAVTVLGAIILGIPRLLAKHKKDTVSLRAGLTVAGDPEVVGGCRVRVPAPHCRVQEQARRQDQGSLRCSRRQGFSVCVAKGIPN